MNILDFKMKSQKNKKRINFTLFYCLSNTIVLWKHFTGIWILMGILNRWCCIIGIRTNGIQNLLDLGQIYQINYQIIIDNHSIFIFPGRLDVRCLLDIIGYFQMKNIIHRKEKQASSCRKFWKLMHWKRKETNTSEPFCSEFLPSS